MTYLLKYQEKVHIACFKETSENQFSFIATDCEGFLSEYGSNDIIMDRINEMNQEIRYKQPKVLQTLATEKPETCVITDLGSSHRIDLKFMVKKYPLEIYFLLSKIEDPLEIAQLFFTGLMKSLMEKTMIVDKLQKALEAKDKEIEDYKRNGAILVRETLLTKPYDRNEPMLHIELLEDRLTMDPDPVLNEANISDLCKMIKAEDLTPKDSKLTKQTSNIPQPDQLKRTRSNGMRSVFIPQMASKKFEYVNDLNESGEVEESIRVANNQPSISENSPAAKKPKVMKKAPIF